MSMVGIDPFTHATDAKKQIWVAWSPTGEGRSTQLELPAPGGTIERAERTPLIEGQVPPVEVAPDASEVAIDEAPLFLFIRADPSTPF